MSKFKVYLKAILTTVIIGGVIGLIISKSIDYNSLKKPFLAPSSILFPIMWTILYVLMGVSYGIIVNKNLVDPPTKLIYYVQLFVNAMWSIIFFTLKWRLFAFFWIVLLDILVIIMIKQFCKKDKTAGLLQVPYLLWILFATYLNLSIYLLNK